MTCQQLLDRIATLGQKIGKSPNLTALSQASAQGNVPDAQQLHYLLEQELSQRQRFCAEIQTLTRQLNLYLKWQSFSPPRVSEPTTVLSPQRYQDLVDLPPEGYLVANLEGLILEANPTAHELLQVSSQKLVGHSLLDFVPETAAKNQVRNAIASLIQKETMTARCEINFSSQQGSQFLAALRLSQICDLDTETTQLHVSLQNISERQQIYQALAASEKKWRALFDQSFQIMALLDGQGKTIDLNQTALELTRHTLLQLSGQHFADLPWWLSVADRAQVRQSIKLAKVGGLVRYEVGLQSSEGEVIPIDLSLKSVQNEQGEVVLLIAEGRDLRDRLDQEAELRCEKEISDSILESLPGVFLMIKRNGPCIRWNQELEKITGYNKREIEKTDPLDFFIFPDRDRIEDKIRAAFTQGKSAIEATFLGKRGQTTTCYLNNLSLKLNGDQDYLIAVGIDITEKKQVENERQKLATLVENSQDLISLTTLHEEVQFLNPAGHDLLGFNHQTTFPLNLKHFFSDQSEQQFITEILPSILKTGQWYGELELKNDQSQKVFSVLANIFLIRDSISKKPINLGVIARDITQRKRTENALKTSEERFRSIFEQATVGIALLDMKGQFQSINQRGAEIFGYSEAELLTLTYQDLMVAELEPERDESVTELLANATKTFSKEQRYRRQDGSWVWVNLTMSLISSSSSQPQSLLAIIEDISDRKIAEAALQKSEEEYRSLVNGIREVIFQLDIDGIWHFLNPAWTEITGYSIAETIGKSFLNYTYLEDFAYHQNQLQNLLKNPDHHCRYQVRCQTKNSSFCWMEVTARVTRNGAGDLTGITGTLNDITERRQAEDQLKAVINTVPGLVSWVSRDGRYLGVNEQLAHTFNLEPQDFVDKEIGFFDTSPSFVHFMYEFLASGDNDTSQVIENTLRNGETRSFLIAAQKYRQASAAVVIGIDITERKQAELALKESENQFRQLAENIEQVFWMVDLIQQNFIYISPAYESTWGRSVQSAYDSPTDWLTSIHPDDYHRVLMASRKQIRGQYDEEYRIIRPDGEVRWIRDRAFPVRNAKGKVYRLAGISEDITERKQAKQALKKRERYLKALVGVQRRLLASKVDESLYKEVLAILGEACEASRIYVYENFVDGQGVRQGDLRAEWYSQNYYHCYELNSDSSFSYEANLGAELYNQLKSGDFIQVNTYDLPEEKQAFFWEKTIFSFLMLPLMVNGEFFGVIGFDNCEASTIWGRLEVGLLSSAAAAIALAKERQFTQETIQQQLTAIETTTDGIMIIHADGKIHYVNPAYCQMLGYDSPAAIFSSQWSYHHPPAERGRIQEEILPHLESHGCWSGEISAQRQDETTFIQELSMNLTQNGEIIGVCRDISDRKEAEKQLKASLEEKELLLKEVHHRVKNNLQVISSIFSLQSQTLEDKQALAILEESQNRISSMALIHEKLYQSANLANIDFVEYIRDLAYHLLASYNVNPNWIKTDMNIQSIPLNLDSAIPCGLLINELVSNSLKHGFPDQRSGRIYIFLGYKDEQKETLYLKVEDDGVGLPEGFNPRKSTSLGFSLITSLTQQLRGTLKFQNNPGASFEVTFPKPIERKRF